MYSFQKYYVTICQIPYNSEKPDPFVYLMGKHNVDVYHNVYIFHNVDVCQIIMSCILSVTILFVNSTSVKLKKII